MHRVYPHAPGRAVRCQAGARCGLIHIFKSLIASGGLPVNTDAQWPLLIAWQSLLAVLEIGNLYYGSLPMIEAMYHRAIANEGTAVIVFSECFYIDREGIRWLQPSRAPARRVTGCRR